MDQNDFRVQKVIAIVKTGIGHVSQLPPTFFVGSGDAVAVMSTEFDTNKQKDMVSQEIRLMVERTSPEYVIFVSEGWMVTKDSTDDHESFREVEGSLEHCPGSEEIVSIIVETPISSMTGIAKILPGRRLTDFEWENSGHSSKGRFMNFFGTKSPQH